MPKNVRFLTELPKSADMVILGAGVAGASVAFYAARAGFHPVVLEKRPNPATLTTAVGSGAFRLQFDNPAEYHLVRHSVELFHDFETATGIGGIDLGLQEQGYAFVTTTEAGAARQRDLVARQKTWGLTDVQLLIGEEARKLLPYLGDNVLQVRWRQKDGFILPKVLTMGLLAASRAGVFVNTEAAGFMTKKGIIVGVKTNQGTISTPQVIIAAGPFSGSVAAFAGLNLPVRILRRQKVVFLDLADAPPWAPFTIDEDSGAHWRPGWGGAQLLYTDPKTTESDPSDNPPTDHQFYTQVMDPDSPQAVARITPFWRKVWERNSDQWILHAGQYVETPDHRPLIGPTHIEGLSIITGFSGHGIMSSPGAGRHLVRLLTGVDTDNPFAVNRDFDEKTREVL